MDTNFITTPSINRQKPSFAHLENQINLTYTDFEVRAHGASPKNLAAPKGGHVNAQTSYLAPCIISASCTAVARLLTANTQHISCAYTWAAAIADCAYP